MRFLIVGGGSIGLKHARAFGSLDPRPELVVLDPREEARKRAAELGADVQDSPFENTDIRAFDGVVICAPAPFHVPFARRCVAQGVPVLSEKPLSHSREGVDELIRAAESPAAPPSGVAFTRRYHPAHEQMREMVAGGDLGRVLCIRISAGQPFTSYRPDYRDIYFARRDMGGGCLLDFASHFIDLAQWYAGPASRMTGCMQHLVLEGVDVEDTVALALEFENKALATIHVNQYQPVNENILDFVCERAVLRIAEPGFACRIWREGRDDWEQIETPPGDYAEALRRQAAAFVAAVGGGPQMRTSIKEAARTLDLCLRLLDVETEGQD